MSEREQTSDSRPSRCCSSPLTVNLLIHKYEGETLEGQPHGEGAVSLAGGHMYKGVFSKGLMDEHGVFTWADGSKYEGHFDSNVMMGHGMYSWPDGSTYVGDIYYGIRHGTGTYCGSRGAIYKGQWSQGKRQGKGAIYYNQDKTSWFKGDWVMNKIEGYGVRRYLSGDVYEGEWSNNQRHGQGTMKWLQVGQQYEGTWFNGVQHGHGTHTWFLKREAGSRYSQSNQYKGDFACGQRHGKGTFYYADGAVYEGEWRKNKKHGKGKFTVKNGKVFQGEFVDDRMIQLRNDRPLPLLACDASSGLGLNMTLNIDSLQLCLPDRQRWDAELLAVELVVLRHSSDLRGIYSFYSRLGNARSPDNTFMLSWMQLWRLLKDCKVHHHGITLSQIELLTKGALEGSTSPFTGILFYKFLSCLVVVAYHIYHADMTANRDVLANSFSKLMTSNILPNAKNVKGFLFRLQEHTHVALQYCRESWELYQAYRTPAHSMTYRELLLIFKDFHLLDDRLSTSTFMEVISEETPEPSNTSSLLILEITFLEFFDALLGCAVVKCCDERQMNSQECEISKTKNTSQRNISEEAKDTSTIHIERMSDFQLTGLESRNEEERQSTFKNQTGWEQRVHQFFDQVFLNAFEHQLVKKMIKQKDLSLKRQSLKVLTGSQQ
ncbi:unnamed protein product [Knipowitschia caucasica]